MNLSFTVYGSPQPQGSARAVPVKGYAKPFITSANKQLKPWRQQVALCALDAISGTEGITDGPVGVHIDFFFAKPKSTAKRVIHKITKPDVDKLLRGILDALAGVLFRHDAQVVSARVTKQFGIPERAEITVRSLEGAAAMKESA